MNVRCPHCQNPIELVEQADLAQVLTCLSCRSSFSLVLMDDDDTQREVNYIWPLIGLGLGWSAVGLLMALLTTDIRLYGIGGLLFGGIPFGLLGLWYAHRTRSDESGFQTDPLPMFPLTADTQTSDGSWHRLCLNSANKSWLAEVRREGDGKVMQYEIALLNTADSGGLLVGSSDACQVRLPDPSVPAISTRITASGNHLFAEVISGSIGWGRAGARLYPGALNRFDSMPLIVGPYSVNVTIREAKVSHSDDACK